MGAIISNVGLGVSDPDIDHMHWLLKQSISQLHKGDVIKFIITVKFNITRKCKTKTSDEHKRCTMHTFKK